MIIDRRQGSYTLLAPLKRYGVPAKMGDLAVVGEDGIRSAADVAFTGNGPDDRRITIGIERKMVTEMLGMSADSRFITKQIPSMLRTYQRVYLVIEGRAYCHRKSGMLMHNGREAGYGRARYLYSTYEGAIMSIREQAGVSVVYTQDVDHTVGWLFSCWKWWQTPWDEHKTLLKVAQASPISAVLERIGPVRKLAAQVPDIGWKRSQVVERAFATPQSMCEAEEEAWAELYTKTKAGVRVRFGKIRAARIVSWLQKVQPRSRVRGKGRSW